MEGRPLSEEDLKLVARLGNLLTQRPQGSRGQTMNHKVTAPIIPFCSSGRVPWQGQTIVPGGQSWHVMCW